MELVLEAAAGGGGSRVVSLSGDAPTADLGREYLEHHGGPSKDHTVSRRHVSLRLLDGGGDSGVAFEVVGRNPVVVRRSSNGGGGNSSSRVFRHGERGELRPGDALSLSLKAPLFWAVRRKGENGEGEVEASVLDAVARRERRTRERKEKEKLAAEEAMVLTKEEEGEAGSEGGDLEIDFARIDPVKEFGFLSMGHEFDSYPKGRIRPPKDWNWFLEEIKRNSDDEEEEVSSRRGRPKGRGGNKTNGEGEDEDWTDESEDEKESLSRGSGVKRTKYQTRSKDAKKVRKEKSKVESGNGNNRDGDEDVEDEEDDQDETLGGFIVNEEDEAMNELSDEEEEEEFDDEDDDD
ncbi:hypothetical protein PR202_gb27725 [Eleusine coracana subsp. coracana]|uniref:FHA domain-containing protein n=1 Tax=Eleusine coracana subsp. coracana TaxID=191504 RepID=A0AAV5FV63_ELECO|nr:hypothetical protein QOZ80_6AG0543190 [Eleusine coracana subsp. coracana]GJN38661.1 hypothetical protein PR202_gb27725 [Eleusine coracana subsp. coracana]